MSLIYECIYWYILFSIVFLNLCACVCVAVICVVLSAWCCTSTPVTRKQVAVIDKVFWICVLIPLFKHLEGLVKGSAKFGKSKLGANCKRFWHNAFTSTSIVWMSYRRQKGKEYGLTPLLSKNYQRANQRSLGALQTTTGVYVSKQVKAPT